MSQGSREAPDAPKSRVEREMICHRHEPTETCVSARRTRFRTVLAPVAAAALGLLVAGCGVDAGASPKSKTSGTVQLTVDGRERSYLLEPAEGASPKNKSALVAVLHQEGGT